MRSKWTEARATAEAAAGVAKKFVTRAVMFFTARGNSFITGQVLYVCGGTSVASISF
jgi:enoyl-[acyl-carrier-protein] reductase (NADH)